MMRAAAVRMCFPSPRGFGGIGERGKVTGGVDRDVVDMIRCRGMDPMGTIRWTVKSGTDLMRIRMPKVEF